MLCAQSFQFRWMVCLFVCIAPGKQQQQQPDTKEVKLRIQIYLFSEMNLKWLSSYWALHVAHFTFIGFCFAFGIRIRNYFERILMISLI